MTAARQLPEGYGYYRLFFDRPENQSWSRAHRLTWTGAAAYGSALGGIDLRGRVAFAFRARTDGGRLAEGVIAVRLSDAAGQSALLPVDPGLRVGGIGPRFSDVIVPLAAAAGRLDLRTVTSVEIVLSGRGSILIDDLRFE